MTHSGESGRPAKSPAVEFEAAAVVVELENVVARIAAEFETHPARIRMADDIRHSLLGQAKEPDGDVLRDRADVLFNCGIELEIGLGADAFHVRAQRGRKAEVIEQ